MWRDTRKDARRASGKTEREVAEGRVRLLTVVTRQTLASRGIPTDVVLDACDLGLTDEDVMDALLQSRDVEEFRARLQIRRL